METLAEIYTKNGTDKGETGHHYGNFYELLFSKYRDKNINILELGIWHGDSVAAHVEYFLNATI